MNIGRIVERLITDPNTQEYMGRYRQVVDGQQILLWCDACEDYLGWDQINIVSLLNCIEAHDRERDHVLFPPS